MTKILVVDDEPQIRQAVERSLLARGYEVQVAGDGAVALDLAAAAPPDLVVLDLNMPVMDGLECLPAASDVDRVPIIVLSVREDEPDKIAALDLGRRRLPDEALRHRRAARAGARVAAARRRRRGSRPLCIGWTASRSISRRTE